MRKVLTATLIGVGLIIMCFAIFWQLDDNAQPMGNRGIRKKKYVKVKPENYN